MKAPCSLLLPPPPLPLALFLLFVVVIIVIIVIVVFFTQACVCLQRSAIPFKADTFKPLDALLCHGSRGRVLLELLVLRSLFVYPSAKLRILGVLLRHIAASSMRVLVRNQLVEFRVPFSID